MGQQTVIVLAMAKCKQNIFDLKGVQFVELQHQTKCLYNVSTQLYHDRTKRDVRWKEIEDDTLSRYVASQLACKCSVHTVYLLL